MIRFTATGWRRWVEQYVRQAATLHLFVGPGLDPSSLNELTGAGYAPHKLLGGAWQLIEVPGMVSAAYPEQSWKFDEALEPEVTGYFVRDAAGAVLWWEAAFADEPFKVRPRRRLSIEIVVQVATEV